MSNNEVIINGGNMSEVYSDGNLVYRDLKPQSKTIHRLLLHLEEKGIDFTPRFLGMNDKSQDILSFVKGKTIDDYPLYSDINGKIRTIQVAATMLREYHDATLDFQTCEDDVWFLHYEGDLKREVICHNDFAPYNVTFQDNKPIGLIDFDTACPAPRIWDVAYAVYRFVPLSKEVYDSNTKRYRTYDTTLDSLERKLLLKNFLDVYATIDTQEILQNVLMRLQALVTLFDVECSKGNNAFIKMKEEGHQQFYINEIEFIKEHMHEWI